MSRFFIPKGSVRGNLVRVSGDEAHHILDVMRLKALDKVVAFDGTGAEYVGFIKETGRRSLVVEVVETRRPKPGKGAKVTLIQAVTKKDKMDYIAEKATELGVYSLIPVVTKRTVPDWDEDKARANVQRWRRIVREAAKQCGRSDIPEIAEVTDLKGALKGSDVYDMGLIAALSDKAVPLKEAVRDFKSGCLAVLIGPEGDFTQEEIGMAQEERFRLVNLGSRVLKSDTAGLAMLAVLNYEFSD